MSDSRLPDPEIWMNRSVLVTGHTGFKGGWMAHWLSSLGAILHGLSLDPPTHPSLFELTAVGSLFATDARGDITDLRCVTSALERAKPEVVFHLAAQPLVRKSYETPVETFEANVMGTVNLLHAVRSSPSVQVVVVITTDKVYRNREWPYPYREIDDLGGQDPYSASKCAAEIVTKCFRQSFFERAGETRPYVVTARAGNVIGGGDWSRDRLVPDALRALAHDNPLMIRNPNALRPWQHVLDPICGYLLLAESLLGRSADTLPESWNFGPQPLEVASVAEVVERLSTLWGSAIEVDLETQDTPHETQVLTLDSSLAYRHLDWRPRWSLDQALKETVRWAKVWLHGEDLAFETRRQISHFVQPKTSA